MPYRLFLDRFTSLDELPKKQRTDPDALLRYFREHQIRRVSTFEMTQGIMNAMKALEKRGVLRWVDSAYPWHDFELKS